MKLNYPLQLNPVYRDYVWGGQRLRPGQLTAEAWVVYSEDLIASGPLEGRKLGELAAEFGPALLGEAVFARSGGRFPLLIKLLDCAQWLSLQVHPNDEQAVQIEGPGASGKTEAWHVLEAAPGAQIIAGMQPGVSSAALEAAVRGGNVLDLVQYVAVHSGDTVFMRAGTIHALGPGLLIYEVQQESDFTYRVFDWNRPLKEGRTLHIDKSLAVANPAAHTGVETAASLPDGGQAELVRCPYFTLKILAAQEQPVALDTAGESFHALTVIAGQAEVTAGGVSLPLNRFQTAILPAGCGAYQVRPAGPFQALLASA
jgi:mannose-6-phosphate isomerase